MPFAAGRKIAAIKEQVPSGRKRLAPASDRFRAGFDRGPVHPAVAKQKPAIRTMGNHMNGVESLSTGQCLADLENAVPSRVEHPDIHQVATRLADHLHEILEIGNPRVDENNFTNTVNRRHRIRERLRLWLRTVRRSDIGVKVGNEQAQRSRGQQNTGLQRFHQKPADWRCFPIF